jgi:nucleoid-associated protein YgaU
MDQVSGNVIAMIMEPDVNDSNGYDGTLVQYGVVSYDETTKNFPIYRYEGNDPRTTLVSNAAEQPVEPETPEQPTEPEQPVEPEKPAEPQQPAGSYTVKAGDSLWSIAQKHLGTGTKWEVIYKANQDLLQNPNQIQIGQVLTIPAA